MAADMRAMLDQLMGKDRDVPLDRRVMRRAQFSDPEVCKHALAGLCPFGLFPNTRSDLGPCEFEIHEDHLDWEGLAAEYAALPDHEKERYGYERSLLRLLSRLVGDMDRKIDKAQERARLEARPKPLKPEQAAEVAGLRQQAKELTERSEKLAEEGDVDASMAAVAQAERLRADAGRLEARYSQPDRYLQVCEVSGVYIQSTDGEARRRDHVEGKQYLGWLAIREKHGELQAKYGGGGGMPPVNLQPVSAPGPARGPEQEEGEVHPGAQHERSRPRSHSRPHSDRRRSRSRSRDRRREWDRRDSRRPDPRYRDSRRDDRRGGYGR